MRAYAHVALGDHERGAVVYGEAFAKEEETAKHMVKLASQLGVESRLDEVRPRAARHSYEFAENATPYRFSCTSAVANEIGHC